MTPYTGDRSSSISLTPFILVTTLLFAMMGAGVWFVSTLQPPPF